MRSKKIISMLAALSLAVSCFVGFASGVSAAQQDIWSSDFETDTKSPFAQYNEPDDTPTRIGQDTIVDGIGSNTSKVYNYQSASNCQNGTHGAIVTKTFDKTITNASFDFYILNDTSAAAQKSGSQQIATIALGNYNQYASSIAAANYNKSNYLSSHTGGTVFNVGGTRQSSANWYDVNNTKGNAFTKDTWYHAVIDIDYEENQTTYSIYSYDANGYAEAEPVKTGTSAFLDSTVSVVDALIIQSSTPYTTVYLDNIDINTDDSLAATANYSIKYQLSDGTEIKTVPGKTGAVGEAPTLLDSDKASFVEKDVKYIYVSDNASDLIVASDDSTVVTVTVRAAEKYSIVVNMVDSNEAPIGSLDTLTAWEGDSVKVAYPRYVIANDSLYFKDASSNEYNYSFTASSNDPIAIEYALQDSKPVYYQEGETIFTNNNVSNANIRCSMGAGGDVSGSTIITTLQPGTYKISTAVWGGGRNEGQNSTYTFTLGSDSFKATTTGSWTRSEGVITIDEAADLTVAKTTVGTSGACIDYVLIEELEPSVTAVTEITDIDAPAWANADTFQVYEEGTGFNEADASVVTGTATTLYIKANYFTPETTPVVTLTDGTECQSHKAVADLATTINNETYFIYQFVGVDSLSGATVEIDGVSTTL